MTAILALLAASGIGSLVGYYIGAIFGERACDRRWAASLEDLNPGESAYDRGGRRMWPL